MNNHKLCPTFALKCASVSDMGMRRMNNQDALAVMVTKDVTTWTTRGHLLIVADGMGAHAAGELASKLAVDNVSHAYFKLRDLLPPAALRQAIRDANAVINNKGQSSIGFQGMGTTCSCLVLLPQGALVAHIGDSRVYRLRDKVLEQLTFDHSLVWEMAAAGQMAQEDVPSYIPKNVITRSLGPHPNVNIDLEGPYNAAAGDVFLLCSDGLSGQVTDEELGAILSCLSPDEAVQTLVDLANLRGGPDNISIVVAHVQGDVPPVVSPTEPTVVEESPPQRRQSSAPFWIASGGCLGVLIYCLVNQYWTGVIVSAAALGAALLGGLFYRSNGSAGCPPVLPLGGPYGNGPYRKASGEPNRALVDALAGVVEQLHQLPNTEAGNWSVDWQPFELMSAQAAAHAEHGDYAAAVREYCHAIREIMKQLREHRPTIENDSDGRTNGGASDLT